MGDLVNNQHVPGRPGRDFGRLCRAQCCGQRRARNQGHLERRQAPRLDDAKDYLRQGARLTAVPMISSVLCGFLCS